MIKLMKHGAYLLNGTELIEDDDTASAILENKLGTVPAKEEAKKNTMAYGILKEHNTSDNMDKLKIKFDCLTSHDITFVGIIQTARASGLTEFPVPYVLTNCHQHLVQSVERLMRMIICLVFLAQKNMAVFMYLLIRRLFISTREMLSGCGRMVLWVPTVIPVMVPWELWHVVKADRNW